jgi:tripartite-type tricarboxylate transporter receptor subunit TctC
MSVRIVSAALFAIAAVLTSAAQAQTFPSRPLRIIVPFPPGGAADVTSRLLGDHMTKGLGQPVVVENHPGAGAVIGYELAARAPADGHTMLVVFPSFVINPSVKPGMSYDPLRDFRSVGQTISLPMGIAVNPSVPATTLQELIALARAKPGEIAYGTPGAGTTHNIIGEMLKLAAKIDLTHAPFQGEAPALTAAAGGHLQMVLVNAFAIVPFAKSGKLRPIVVTTPERAEGLPDVPTVREAGYPELESTNWAGLVVPAATPPAAITRLNSELVSALRSAEIQDKFKSYGMLPVPGTPEQFDAFLQSEYARYAKVVREAGIKAD